MNGILSQVEMDSKKPKSNFGLSLLMNCINWINHGGDTTKILNVTNNINLMRKKIFEEKFMQNLIKKYLLDNKHCVISIMNPQDNFNE